MKISLATPANASALLSIYAEYISTAITFECHLPTETEFARRIQEIQRVYPYLILHDDQQIYGYAYAHAWQTREAYQWGAELSIYLSKAFHGRGYGRKMYQILLALLHQQGVRTVYGCITTPNQASERLHAQLGFRQIGIFRRAGFKNGQWHDIAWWEKAIADYDFPTPLRPISTLLSPSASWDCSDPHPLP